MDREAWRAAIHGVAKSRTRLSHLTELNGLELKDQDVNSLRQVVYFSRSELMKKQPKSEVGPQGYLVCTL